MELNVDSWLGPDATPEVRALVRTMQRRAFDVQLAADDLPEPPQRVWPELDPARATQPTLLVSGQHDFVWFTAVAAHLASVMPDAEHLVLPWAGHLPSLERPERFDPLVLGFVSGR